MFNFTEKIIGKFTLKIMQSSIFVTGLKHFFTTRVGADTPKPLDSFTLSAKDLPKYKDYEIKNQKIACEILGGNYENFVMPNQQHTDKIAIIKGKSDIHKIKEEPYDGVITTLKNIPVCLVFADCVPVIIFDEKKKVLACLHAGWKGTAKGIVKKAVRIMQKDFGCETNNLKAAIGAAICQKCFEVNPDVARQLAMSIKNTYGNIFIEDSGKVHVDLKRINEIQLNEEGVFNVDVCEYCTSCDNNLFYSYRADNRCTGRHGMLAMIEE